MVNACYHVAPLLFWVIIDVGGWGLVFTIVFHTHHPFDVLRLFCLNPGVGITWAALASCSSTGPPLLVRLANGSVLPLKSVGGRSRGSNRLCRRRKSELPSSSLSGSLIALTAFPLSSPRRACRCSTPRVRTRVTDFQLSSFNVEGKALYLIQVFGQGNNLFLKIFEIISEKVFRSSL